MLVAVAPVSGVALALIPGLVRLMVMEMALATEVILAMEVVLAMVGGLVWEAQASRVQL
jgi:hypothetical protein